MSMVHKLHNVRIIFSPRCLAQMHSLSQFHFGLGAQIILRGSSLELQTHGKRRKEIDQSGSKFMAFLITFRTEVGMK